MTSNNTGRARRGRANQPRPLLPLAILGAGILAATVILAGAVRDSIPPPQTTSQLGPVLQTPHGPASPPPETPDGQ